jgi:hypothetical protein
MKNKLLLFFIFVWASADAQTFEKTIDYPGYLNTTLSLNTDNQSNIYLTELNITYINGPLFGIIDTKSLKLDPLGDIIESKTFKSQNFITSIDTSFNQLVTMISLIDKNEMVNIGYIRVAPPQTFASIIYTTDLSYNLKSFTIQDTIQDSIYEYNNYTVHKNKIYSHGTRFSYLTGEQKGDYGIIDSSKTYDYQKSIFSYTDSIYSLNVINMLFDKNNNQYIFTWGLFEISPLRIVSPIQILKFDDNFRLTKKIYVENPNKRPLIDGPINFTYGSAKWISDSTFIFATAGVTDNDLKGDIHLFVYDTALTNLKYKRIEALDTLLEAEHRSLAYDSICDCFYFGATQKFENSNRPVLNGRDSTHFRLIKFDKDLNILFDRQYRRNKSMKLERVTTDAQGNVIMAGYTQDLSQPFNETSIYILKVDSNGNFTRTSLMDHNQIDPLDYAIFPNPVKEQATFRQYNQQVSYQLSLFDINGRLVKEIQIVNSETTLNLTELKSGTYLYQLIDENGKRGSGKLVKE